MIRYILIIISVLLVYYAVKAIVRSALGTDTRDKQKGRLPGDEMVLDPECHTYVVKRRAVTRRINGELRFFCSETCAGQFDEKNRA
jgi:YHS domain-containing protein